MERVGEKMRRVEKKEYCVDYVEVEKGWMGRKGKEGF